MNFDKDTILQFLHSMGQHDQANQAAQELPDQVDTDQHAGLLSKFGVNPSELIAKFSGGLDGLGSIGGANSGTAQTAGTDTTAAGTDEGSGLGGILGKLI